MSCIWCHNPEAISAEPQIAEYSDKCISCGRCAAACSYDAVTFENDKRLYNREKSIACGACAQGCPTGALKLIGTQRDANDVFAELASDIPYYENSGGGVTLSGGEPLLQADFCEELLQRCFEAGIDTAIETSLSLPFERIERLLPWLKRVFFDIKHFDDDIHKKYTGVNNNEGIREQH